MHNLGWKTTPLFRCSDGKGKIWFTSWKDKTCQPLWKGLVPAFQCPFPRPEAMEKEGIASSSCHGSGKFPSHLWIEFGARCSLCILMQLTHAYIMSFMLAKAGGRGCSFPARGPQQYLTVSFVRVHGLGQMPKLLKLPRGCFQSLTYSCAEWLWLSTNPSRTDWVWLPVRDSDSQFGVWLVEGCSFLLLHYLRFWNQARWFCCKHKANRAESD